MARQQNGVVTALGFGQNGVIEVPDEDRRQGLSFRQITVDSDNVIQTACAVCQPDREQFRPRLLSLVLCMASSGADADGTAITSGYLELVWHTPHCPAKTNSTESISLSTPSDTVPAEQTPDGGPLPSSSAILLRPQIWLEPDIFLLVRDGCSIPLSTREAQLFDMLLQHPGRYHSATRLAEHLTKPGAFPVDPHGVEQTVYNMRRKLGETPRRPSVIRTHREAGYAIFPVSNSDVE
jgi:hypothetical protein